MRYSFRRYLRPVVTLTLALFTLPAFAIDLLELPAVQSKAASRTILLDIARRDENSFVAVGTFGVAIVSEDNGASWKQASVPASVTLTSVHFPTPKLGWAVGHDGLVLHSSDGGMNWEKQLDGYELNEQILQVAERIVENTRSELEALQADENADEYAIEDAEFMLEEAEFMLEGAMDDTEAGPVRPLLDVWFKNESEGIIAGSYGMLLLTSDGGQNWSLESDRMENPEAFHLNHIQPAPDGSIFIAGESGFVFRSRDGGASWDSLEPGYEGSYFGLVISPQAENSYELLVYGLQGNAYRSTDQGDNWEQVDNDSRATLMTGVHLSDSSLILAGAGGAILRREAGQSALQRVDNDDTRVISGLIESDDGSLILVGLGGIRKVGPDGMPLNAGNETQGAAQ